MSYRRNDAAGHAGRLYDRLSLHFGTDRVFRDLDSLVYGTQFLEAIRQAVSTCDSLVAVIGREWLSVSKPGGGRRLDEARDFVRLEVAAALERGIPVIPVLVEGAAMPDEADLPLPLVRLCQYNGLELSDSRWDFDVGRLITALEQWTPRAPASPLAGPGPTLGPAPSPPASPLPPAPPTTDGGSSPISRRALLLIVVGVVTALGLLGLALLGGGADPGGGGADPGGGDRSPEASPERRVVTVAGTQQWTDSGIDVTVGDRIQVTATGTVFHNGSSSAGPDGAPDPGLRAFNILKDADHAGLLGRVGETGASFHLGGQATLTVPAAGRLYLGINDVGVDNNSGAYTATVEVDGG